MASKIEHYYIRTMLWIAEKFHAIGHWFCGKAIDQMDYTTRKLKADLDEWMEKDIVTNKAPEVDPRLH